MLEESEFQELKSRLKNEFSGYRELAGGKNYRYHHLVAVHRYVKALMEKEELRGKEVDERVVEVAAIFHDIGRKEDIEDGYMDPFEGHEGHAETGEDIVAEYVEDFLSEEQLEKVEKVIGNHHSEPETVEGKILQDADRLGKFGTWDIWRMIHYGSEKEREMPEMFEYFWDTAMQRYHDELPEFHFEVSRRVAKERMVKYQETMKRIEEEYLGEDI
ncbi:MAG: HD domain-containing protein [Candidatus Nanohaloarchaea archaeon]